MSVRSDLLAVTITLVFTAAAGVSVWLYGKSQYHAGASAKQAEIEKRQIAVERAWQEEKDRADANYRAALLAREHTQVALAAAERDRDAAFARVDGLRRQLAQRSAASAGTGRGPDEASADWIGLFGECLARSESLGRRLGEVGSDAARWADQVNGLQGYIRGVQGAASGGG